MPMQCGTAKRSPVREPKNLGYDNLFRILIVQFIDAQTFDLRSIKKTCIHIAHPDGERLIPFDTYNMFYRDSLEQTRLAPLRDEAMAFRQATV
jgi:7,8-dihydro-6-hydroxymethylpterin dimethyltransferase